MNKLHGVLFDNQNVVAQVHFRWGLLRLFDRSAVFVQFDVRHGGLAFRQFDELLMKLVFIDAGNGAGRRRDFAQIADELLAPVGFLLDFHSSAQVHAQLASDGL